MIGRVLSLGVALLVVTAAIPAGADDRSRPPHHEIDIQLDPDAGRLEVVDRVTLSGPATVDLRLAPWLRISELSVDGRPIAVNTLESARLPLAVGETRDVALTYGGTLPTERRSDRDGPLIGPEGSYLPAGAGGSPSISTQPRITLRRGFGSEPCITYMSTLVWCLNVVEKPWVCRAGRGTLRGVMTWLT